NPDCPRLTSGPSTDPNKAVNLGVAAHITAAAPGGPRYDAKLLPAERQAPENGIWLCQTCSVLIDKDVLKYPVSLLREWKRQAEASADAALAKGTSLHGGSPAAAAIVGQLAGPLGQHIAAAVQAAMQAPAGPVSNAIDAELEEAKQELERHQPDLAR